MRINMRDLFVKIISRNDGTFCCHLGLGIVGLYIRKAVTYAGRR